MKNQEVWLAQYLECSHEGGWDTLSAHKTRRGAKTVILEHERGMRKDFQDRRDRLMITHPAYCESLLGEFPDWHDWRTKKVEVLP